MKVRILKQANSLKIVIPEELKLPENMEYQLIVDDDGVISLIPISDNVFAANPDYDFRSAIEAMQLGDNGNPIGKEDVW